MGNKQALIKKLQLNLPKKWSVDYDDGKDILVFNLSCDEPLSCIHVKKILQQLSELYNGDSDSIQLESNGTININETQIRRDIAKEIYETLKLS